MSCSVKHQLCMYTIHVTNPLISCVGVTAGFPLHRGGALAEPTGLEINRGHPAGAMETQRPMRGQVCVSVRATPSKAICPSPPPSASGTGPRNEACPHRNVACSVALKVLHWDPQGQRFDPWCGHDKIRTAVGALEQGP